MTKTPYIQAALFMREYMPMQRSDRVHQGVAVMNAWPDGRLPDGTMIYGAAPADLMRAQDRLLHQSRILAREARYHLALARGMQDRPMASIRLRAKAQLLLKQGYALRGKAGYLVWELTSRNSLAAREADRRAGKIRRRAP